MKQFLLTTAALVALASFAQPALADAETEALKKEIKALSARIAELEKREKEHSQTVSAPAPALEKRVAIVERNQELQQEDAKAKAASTPSITVGSKGLTVTSPDKQYSVNMRGYIQADNRTFLASSGTGSTDTFLIRSMRPIVEAKMTDYFNGRFMIDFGRGQSTLLDAYGDFHPVPGNDIINLRLGEFKTPVGLERWQSEQEVLFVERGMTTNLVPYRDVGLMAYGQLIPNQLEYQLALTNGAADLQANTGDSDNHKDVFGRIFARPFRWSGIGALDGLALGLAGSYGTHQGNTTNTGLTSGYVSPGQRAFFTYRTTGGAVYANGSQWRVNPQAMYYNGPFGAFGEYVLNSQEISRNSSSAALRNNAWFTSVSYVLTGEDASFDGVKPLHNFRPSAGEWGAFELVGRHSELNVDSDAFATFADSTVSARKASETTVGGTWYFNPSVKFNLDFSFTSFNGGATTGDRDNEKVVMTRGQFRF